MKKFISLVLAVIMVLGLLPVSSLAEVITADAPNSGVEKVEAGSTSAETKATTLSGTYYQKVDDIDSTSAKYLIVYEGDDVPRALTAVASSGSIQAADNALELNIEQVGTMASGGDGVFQITNTSGGALTDSSKWKFSTTTTAASNGQAVAMYVQNANNNYYLQGNSKQSSGRFYNVNPTTYTGIGSYQGYAIDTLMLQQYPVAPIVGGTALWAQPTAQPANKFTIEQIAQAARYITGQNGYYMSTIPSTVNVAGTSVAQEDFYLMMERAVVALNGGSGKTTQISYSTKYTKPTATVDCYFESSSSQMPKASYVTWASDDIAYADANTGGEGNMPYRYGKQDSVARTTYWAMFPLYVRILADMYNSGAYTLPANAYLDSGATDSTAANTAANKRRYTFTVQQIGIAAQKANVQYTTNGAAGILADIPTGSTLKIGNGITLTHAQFFTMMADALYDIYNSSTNKKTYKPEAISAPTSSDGGVSSDTFGTGATGAISVPIKGIIYLASRARKYINDNSTCSNYSTGIYDNTTATTATGTQLSSKVSSYVRVWLLFARTMAYYARIGSLPNTCTNRLTSYTQDPYTAASGYAHAAIAAPTVPPVASTDDSHIPVAISSPLYTGSTNLTENCMLVMPRMSNRDTALSLPSTADAVELDPGLFAFGWYNNDAHYYYRTSFIRYTDGRYGDRFVFSPGRHSFTQIGTKNANSTNILATGTRAWQSDWFDRGVDLDGDGKTYEYLVLTNDYTAAGYAATSNQATKLPDALSAFMHYMRPSFFTVYKEVSSPSINPLEEEQKTPLLSEDDPLYPAGGSTTINKTAKGINWDNTGVGEVELSVKGMGVRQYTDFVIIQDISKSLWVDGNDRPGASQAAVNAFADIVLAPNKYTGEASNNRIALVSFGYYGNQVQGFTNNPTTVKNAVKNELTRAASIQYNATNYDEAFRNANKYLASRTATEKATRDAVVIFLTDGAPTFYNDNAGISYWGVAHGGMTYSGGASDPNYGVGGPVSTVGYTAVTYLWYGGLSIDAPDVVGTSSKAGAHLDDNSRWQSTVDGKSYTNSINYRFMEDVFMYSTRSRNGAGDTKINVDGDENMMGKRTILNSTLMQADKAKELYGAEVYAIGLDVDTGSTASNVINDNVHRETSGIPHMFYTGEECEKIITSIASDENHVYMAEESNLTEKFEEIAANYVINPATETVVTDEMGVDYDLKYTPFNNGSANVNPTIVVKSYNLITRDMIGSTQNGVKVTEAHVGNRLSDQATVLETVTLTAAGAATSSVKSGDIWTGDASTGKVEAKYFTYDFQTETFTWNIGELGEQEVTLTYNVYLTGTMEGTRARGVYDTNEIATLSYINVDGNPVSKDFPVPNLPWGGAVTSYEYYLVNAQGVPVNMQGQTVGTDARTTVYGPVSKNLNLNASTDGQAINASANIPVGYTLYNPNASYTVKTASGDLPGSVTVSDNGSPVTTLIINSNPNNSHVAFAVVYNEGAVDDFVVLDWDKKVQVDVTKNDTMARPKLVALSLNTEGDSATAANGVALNSVTTTLPVSTTTVDGVYGNASIVDGKVEYALDKIFDAREHIFCWIQAGENALYSPSKFTVIPATNVYYEDSFATSNEGENATRIFFNGNWVVTDTEDNEYQDSNGYAYGYDPSYNDDIYDSNGSSRVLTSTNTELNSAAMSFVFKGTGFDIVGRTTAATGSILYRITDMEANKILSQSVVNTLYTYGELYQIPIISWESDNYGTYKVELFAFGTPARSQTVYVDGIRIYNPLGTVEDHGTEFEGASGAYHIHGEYDPVVFEVRPLLFTQNTGEELEKAVFINGSTRPRFATKDLYMNFALRQTAYVNGAGAGTVGAMAAYPTTDTNAYGFAVTDYEGQLTYEVALLMLTRVLAAYGEKGTLPNEVDLEYVPKFTTTTEHTPTSATFTLQNVVDAATQALSGYTVGTEFYPAGVTVNGVNISVQNYFVMASQAIQDIYNGNLSATYSNASYNYNKPTSSASYTLAYVLSGANTTNKSDAFELGPNNEMYLNKNQTLAFSITTKAAPAAVQIGAKSPYGQELAFTVASDSVMVPITQKVTSATNMFYEITNGLKFIDNGDGTFTADVIIVNTSAGDAATENAGGSVLSITDIKVVLGDATKGVAISSDKQLVEEAIALTEKLRDTEEANDGEVIAIIGGTEYENGKQIKTNLFNEEVADKNIFKNIALWYFSKLR